MFSKVSPNYPNKIADRIAGAIVDLAYSKSEMPVCEAEVVTDREGCTVLMRTDVDFTEEEICGIVGRIMDVTPDMTIEKVPGMKELACTGSVDYTPKAAPKDDGMLALATSCLKYLDGDGVVSECNIDDSEQREDGSCVRKISIDIQGYQGSTKEAVEGLKQHLINQNWDVIELYQSTLKFKGCALSNYKLESDLGCNADDHCLLHGYDLSLPSVTLVLYALFKAEEDSSNLLHMKASEGDTTVDGKPYSYYVNYVKEHIYSRFGSFEKFAEWGFV